MIEYMRRPSDRDNEFFFLIQKSILTIHPILRILLIFQLRELLVCLINMILNLSNC